MLCYYWEDGNTYKETECGDCLEGYVTMFPRLSCLLTLSYKSFMLPIYVIKIQHKNETPSVCANVICVHVTKYLCTCNITFRYYYSEEYVGSYATQNPCVPCDDQATSDQCVVWRLQQPELETGAFTNLTNTRINFVEFVNTTKTMQTINIKPYLILAVIGKY